MENRNKVITIVFSTIFIYIIIFMGLLFIESKKSYKIELLNSDGVVTREYITDGNYRVNGCSYIFVDMNTGLKIEISGVLVVTLR